MKRSLILTLVAVCVVVIPISNLAQLNANRSGRLDRHYAQNGIGVYGASMSYGNSLALDDGSLFQVSTAEEGSPTSQRVIELRKFDRDGLPDPEFGINGRRTYMFGHQAGGIAIARLGDGKLLIAGSVNPSWTYGELDFLVFRLHPNGDLDTSFGNNGTFIKDFPSPVQGEATQDSIDVLHLLPDGKILATGTSTRYMQSQNGISHARSVKLNQDGSVDASFADAGFIATNIGYDDYSSAGGQESTSAIDPQGRLVVGVVPYSGPGNETFYTCKILRYLPNGSLDPSFAQEGVRILTPELVSSCSDFAFLQDGKILVLAGWKITRLNENGSTDTTFAASGSLYMGQNNARFADMLVTESGKIYVAGTQQASLPGGGVSQYAIVRGFHSNGMADVGFGTGGSTRRLTSNEELAGFRRLHRTTRGLVATGTYLGPQPFYRFVLARFTIVPW